MADEALKQRLLMGKRLLEREVAASKARLEAAEKEKDAAFKAYYTFQAQYELLCNQLLRLDA